MTAAVKNLVIEQRATFKLRLAYKNAQKKPINLTGFTAKMQIRDAGGSLIANLTTSNGGITISGSAGLIDLLISASDTSAMNFTSALYDLVLIAPDSTDTRLLQGKVTLSPGQTVTA